MEDAGNFHILQERLYLWAHKFTKETYQVNSKRTRSIISEKFELQNKAHIEKEQTLTKRCDYRKCRPNYSHENELNAERVLTIDSWQWTSVIELSNERKVFFGGLEMYFSLSYLS